MLDFLMISTKSPKRGVVEVFPKFIIKKSNDLMIRGGDFYAIWDAEKSVWSTDEDDAIRLIDEEIKKFVDENQSKFDSMVIVKYMWDADSGMIDSWHRYCQKQLRDHFHMLDEKLIFSNSKILKRDYSSKRLPYPLESMETPAYDKLMSTLYSEEERHKIEWAIGCIVSGESKKVQKFMVLYGSAGTGKSTVLNIIQKLFDGYYSVFDARALGSYSNSFALESFRTNPLVAIQHDGDLSKIEDNTRLNSLVSHEMMTVNEKFTKGYSNSFKCFLFMGTNKPVKITDAKSGLIRRLIDVTPTGEKLSGKEYRQLMKQIEFELPGIASKCLDIFNDFPGYYDDYMPLNMMSASNDFYNYVLDNYHIFKKEDGTTLRQAWELYKIYCDDAKIPYPLSQKNFKEELKNYFYDFNERFNTDDGSRVRSYFSGFRTEKFILEEPEKKNLKETLPFIEFGEYDSIFDRECSDCQAQYGTVRETPKQKWDEVTTTLKDLDTSKLHFVRVPLNHIVIDFDIKENGKKSFSKNLEEASKWPATYAELSKSGNGIHLHYIYTGDPTTLSSVYDDNIEIKVYNGNSSLRRKLTKCNKLPIATISSGLPLKGDKKMVNFTSVKNEKALRTLIKRNLNKEIHSATKPSVDFIKTILDDAYNSNMNYDVSDMYNDILAFAAQSTNQSLYCIKLVSQMHFKSEDISQPMSNDDAPLVFFDVEVFPNLFLVNWKRDGDKKVNRMINPTSQEIEDLCKFNLVGFNNRRYDNHMLYARLIGYSNEKLYDLSQKIVGAKKGSKGVFFGEAYNISYTDIYDFAATKQSLKKWEIELGIHHQELGLPWDQPVPEDQWEKVAEYCDNDVIATEAVFHHLAPDFTARQILAAVAGMTVNDTTNTLTTKIIFGGNKKPQNVFNYRDMGKESKNDITPGGYDEYTRFNDGKPIFPGYVFDRGVSTYRGEEVGEGGYVYAEPGIYSNIALLDIASMHPSSIIAEQLFGEEYTKRFEEIKEARIAIKHKDFDSARKMLNGALEPYLTDESTAKNLAQALKIAINSVYGLTSASFEHPFHDPRNIDNIVAKRGALFMINLKHEVQKRGFTVAHIKTDSIKIPEATDEIIQFVMDYGKMYGYIFEHEATYDRMCLVNNAVYIAKYKTGEWTATGTQFQVPYVFKTLFSKEDITFDDLCETKSVTSALYLDFNESHEDDPDYHDLKFVGKIGRFCPIKPGKNGGLLLREGKDKEGNVKYDSAVGAKDFRWQEAELIKNLNKEKDIDRNYYENLVQEAINAIGQYGDAEWFIYSEEDDISPWLPPCGDAKYDTCFDCPSYKDNACAKNYNINKLMKRRSKK